MRFLFGLFLLAATLRLLAGCGPSRPAFPDLSGERHFSMTAWGAPEDPSVDLPWGVAPDGRSYDVWDEPFWECPPCDAQKPPADYPERRAALAAAVAAAQAAGHLAWVNFSWPEVEWWARGLIEPPAADVLSLDDYRPPEGWSAMLGHLEAVRTHLAPQQRMAVVPQGFIPEGPGDYARSEADVVLVLALHLRYALDHPEVAYFAPWPWRDVLVYPPTLYHGLAVEPGLRAFLADFRAAHPLPR